jgi:hypothetical protein
MLMADAAKMMASTPGAMEKMKPAEKAKKK